MAAPEPTPVNGRRCLDCDAVACHLLEERVGQSMLDDPSFEPAALAEQLARLIRERPTKRRFLLAGIAAVALLIASPRSSPSSSLDDAASPGSTPRPPGSPLGSHSARLRPPLLRANDAVWAATPSGALIKVDVSPESVVGAPLKLFPDNAYVTLAVDEDTLWAGGPGLLVRLDSPTGACSTGSGLGTREVSGLPPPSGRCGHPERWAESEDRADRARASDGP